MWVPGDPKNGGDCQDWSSNQMCLHPTQQKFWRILKLFRRWRIRTFFDRDWQDVIECKPASNFFHRLTSCFLFCVMQSDRWCCRKPEWLTFSSTTLITFHHHCPAWGKIHRKSWMGVSGIPQGGLIVTIIRQTYMCCGRQSHFWQLCCTGKGHAA